MVTIYQRSIQLVLSLYRILQVRIDTEVTSTCQFGAKCWSWLIVGDLVSCTGPMFQY